MLSYTKGYPPEPALLTQSSAPLVTMSWSQKEALALEAVWGDAYGVQHHGEDSSQAIQSVAIHLLTLHGAITRSADGFWVKRRATRTRVFFTSWNLPHWGAP